MKKLSLFIFLYFTISFTPVLAQDTLPKFSLVNAGNNRVIIGWVNKFENVKQISIQRSHDSLNGYKSILTVADPNSPQNGFMDAKAPNDHMYYRIYIMLNGGMFLFSEAKRPVIDSQYLSKNLGKGKNGNTPSDSVERAKPVVIQLNGFPGTDSVNTPNPVTLKNKTMHLYPLSTSIPVVMAMSVSASRTRKRQKNIRSNSLRTIRRFLN
jgi:hypothetical protein